jgi:hypothetical protein
VTTAWAVGFGLFTGLEAAADENGVNQGDLLAQIHFVGTAQISGSPSDSLLEELWRLPAAVQLKEQTLGKLAKAPFKLLQRRAAPGSLDYAPLFRPLLEDLLSSESYLEIRALGAEFPELSWSIRLNDTRAQVWKTNLATVATAWTAVHTKSVQVEGFNGWELKKHHPPDLLRVVKAGEWLVIGLGQERLPSQDATVERIRQGGRPVPPAKDYWLKVSLNGPELGRRIEFTQLSSLPEVQLALRAAGENTQAHLVFRLSADLDWKPSTWQIPANMVRGPVMSFTAAQGLGSWLSQWKALQRYAWVPVPGQLFTWTEAENPLQTYLAAPVTNATNLLEQLAPKIASALNTNLHRASVGSIRWRPKEQEVVWEGVPFISPFLRAVRNGSGDYLLAGMIHTGPGIATVRESPAQVKGLTNQVYFDWENTGLSLARWRNLSLLLLPLSGKGLMGSEASGAKWLEAIGPKLGQTATQGTLIGPRELQFIREGRPGLTGIELVALANWLEATNFPWGGYQVPARRESEH